MGRRRLPKLDPAVDYSRHLWELDAVPAGTVAGSLFAAPQRPLEIEIGSGKGLFLLNQSAAQPDHNYLGIEIAKKYARFAAYRLAKYERNNAVVIRGDGLKFCAEHVLDSSVAAYHVYFPDPWWKERHRRRRVIQTEFIQTAQRTLVAGGKFIFWTDVAEYFETGCEQIKTDSNFLGPYTDQATAVVADVVESTVPALNGQDARLVVGRTHFDRRMLRNDHEVFRCYFVQADSGF